MDSSDSWLFIVQRNKLKSSLTIGIVGAGPVGLMCALFLQRSGHKVQVFEKHTKRLPSSRSIGIHAPSIHLFDQLGLSKPLLLKAQQINTGVVYYQKKMIGKLPFSVLDHPFPMVLTLEQSTTESLLEEACSEAKIPVHKSFELISINNQKDSVQGLFKKEGKERKLFNFDLLIGADGYKSAVRYELELPYLKQALPDFYAMADFVAPANDDRNARLYLHKKGIIESFPLPQHRRRWIVRFDEKVDFDDPKGIVSSVAERCGVELKEEAEYFSSFRPFTLQSKQYQSGRVLLMGDAAQVVSPIGGQGMNIGWMQSYLLSKLLDKSTLENHRNLTYFLVQYNKEAKQIGKAALKQSVRNTWMGRGGGIFLKGQIARLLASPLFSKQSARVFSMQWLEEKVIEGAG